jgi:hypothetical protein
VFGGAWLKSLPGPARGGSLAEGVATAAKYPVKFYHAMALSLAKVPFLFLKINISVLSFIHGSLSLGVS